MTSCLACLCSVVQKLKKQTLGSTSAKIYRTCLDMTVLYAGKCLWTYRYGVRSIQRGLTTQLALRSKKKGTVEKSLDTVAQLKIGKRLDGRSRTLDELTSDAKKINTEQNKHRAAYSAVEEWGKKVKYLFVALLSTFILWKIYKLEDSIHERKQNVITVGYLIFDDFYIPILPL